MAKKKRELVHIDSEELKAQITQSKPKGEIRESGLRIELWVDEYLSNGLNAKEAHFKVFGTVVGKTAVVEFKSRPDVRKMLALKTRELALNSLVTKLDLIDELNEIKDHCRHNARNALMVANWVRVIELQTRMLGFNEPDKLDVRLAQATVIDFGIDDEPEDISIDEDIP
jgi:hypothetical protein